MFKHKWSAIIYGRSYHVDFRFITIPQDFTSREKDWAAEYILATFKQANKLATSPRWSLFKNESHCVVGVTCMVRDLLHDMNRELIELLSRDNRGRPLYVFVGYVTQLDRRKRLLDFPRFSDRNLQNFQNLHQYLLEVWQVEEYYQDSKKPIFNDYQGLDFQNQEVKIYDTLKLAKQINHQEKYPQQTYLWQNTNSQKENLWIASAICHQPISLCLGDRHLKHTANSPFLNQTVTTNATNLIEDCVVKKVERRQLKSRSKVVVPETEKPSFSRVIKNKVTSDFKTTVEGVKVIKNKSQGFWKRSSKENKQLLSDITIEKQNKNLNQESNFGFKTKPKSKNSLDREWF